MNKLSLKGIVWGGIADILASVILGLPVVTYVMVKLELAHTPKDQVPAAVHAALQGHTSLYALQLAIGMACSVLGGYVGARLAKHDELLNGALTSMLCVALGIYSLATKTESGSQFIEWASFVLSPALGMLGGYLRLAQNRRAAASEPIGV
ncbi:MAG TPA: hypothetical protein VK805_03685 [Candidatus Baltobacteraceae bacterium]|nr:hypothetical protein [Candidatus Baltobacteraceae bacterium]